MKKILIGIDSLRIGGIQTALINLLNYLDLDKYDVTLLLFHYDKEYEKLFPADIKLCKASWLLDVLNHTMDEAKAKGGIVLLLRMFGTLCCRLFGSANVYRFLLRSVKDATEYDEAISFTNNGHSRSVYFGMNKCILERIHAKKKSSWLHVDFDRMGLNTAYNISEYSRFDRIIHVSRAAKETFLRFVPYMRDKSYVIYNLLRKQLIAEKDNASCPEYDRLRVITVGRLDPNKNVMACIEIAAELKRRGISFEWNIVGDGGERSALTSMIADYGLTNEVKIRGYSNNPYPEMAQSHFLVSTSKTESYGMAIAEAIALTVPVIAFEYPAISEIVTSEENGFIVEQGDVQGVVNIIERLWKDKHTYEAIKRKCRSTVNEISILSDFDAIFGRE